MNPVAGQHRAAPSMAAVLALVVLAAAGASAADSVYVDARAGVRAVVPGSWKLHSRTVARGRTLVAWSLPRTWSAHEGQEVVNAVSISAEASPELRSVDDVVEHELQRHADILVATHEVEGECGRSLLEVSRIGGLFYVSRSTYFFANGVGYVVVFAATEGTYARNLGQYERLLGSVSFLPPARVDEPDLDLVDAGLARLSRVADVYPPRLKTPADKLAALELWRSIEHDLLRLDAADPDDYDILARLGQCDHLAFNLGAEEAHARAVEYLTRAIHLAPDAGLAHLYLGRHLVFASRWEEGCAELLRAIDSGERKLWPKAYEGLMNGYYQLGAYDRAILYARQYLFLDPDNRAARSFLDMAEKAAKAGAPPRAAPSPPGPASSAR